jgi:RNA polymerase sigma-70 factor (ECF subfamily)
LNDSNSHIEAIKSGDKNAFDKLFLEYYSYLCNYAFKFVKEVDTAEEIVQDVFYKIWENRSQLLITTSIKSYLFRSVHNQCLNLIKHISVKENYKQHNQDQINYQENTSNNPAETRELADLIDISVKALPTERQKIFKMSREEGLKYREVAEKLNISIKTVEAQMGKALKFLRTELADYLPTLLLIKILIEFIN